MWLLYTEERDRILNVDKFCSEDRILSKKYRDDFLGYVKKGQPDLLKLSEEYLDREFREYKHGSKTIVGKLGSMVIPMDFVRHDVKDEDQEDEWTGPRLDPSLTGLCLFFLSETGRLPIEFFNLMGIIKIGRAFLQISSSDLAACPLFSPSALVDGLFI